MNRIYFDSGGRHRFWQPAVAVAMVLGVAFTATLAPQAGADMTDPVVAGYFSNLTADVYVASRHVPLAEKPLQVADANSRTHWDSQFAKPDTEPLVETDLIVSIIEPGARQGFRNEPVSTAKPADESTSHATPVAAPIPQDSHMVTRSEQKMSSDRSVIAGGLALVVMFVGLGALGGSHLRRRTQPAATKRHRRQRRVNSGSGLVWHAAR